MSFLSKIKKATKVISALSYLAVVIFAALFSYKQGFSQYSTKVAALSQDSSKLSQIINSDPANPEAYKLRGLLSLKNNNYQDAAADFKQAIDLRPNDYLLWLQLGFTNNKLENFDEAKVAYEKSVELAPNYFQPRQYLGFFYLRQNKPKPAFLNLSQAAAIKPKLLPEVLQLAYQIFLGNPTTIERLVPLNTVEAKKEMASFFIKNNIVTDKTIAFLNSQELNEEEKNQFINQLIKAKNYELAFSIWASKKNNKTLLQNSDKNLLLNGDFENSISSKEIGFGWQIQDLTNTNLKLDNKKPFSGSGSLEITFAGKSDPANSIISQLAIVKPNQKYKLSFAFRSEELVTGGLPIMTIVDADSGNIINQSAPLASVKNQWQNFTIDFKTGNQIKALTIKIQRLNCKENPCPIFGKLWLDEFKLQEF